MEYITAYWLEAMAAMALVIAVVVMIYIFVLSARLRTYKRLAKLVKGGDVEEHIWELEKRCALQGQAIQQLQMILARMQAELGNVPRNWHLNRYNAFTDTGSQLSFSLAILDDVGNGVVLTSIYGRDENRVYAKPLTSGKSEYPLSDEEKQAVAKALASAGKHD